MVPNVSLTGTITMQVLLFSMMATEPEPTPSNNYVGSPGSGPKICIPLY